MTHIGIRLRITSELGTLVDLDSDMLHNRASMTDRPACTPRCLPHCREHGWWNLLADYSPMQPGLRIEVKPVELPDFTEES